VQIRRFIDSHTEGEPTRVLLGDDRAPLRITLPELLARWTRDGRLVIPPEMLALAAHPRAAEATVCALACNPASREAACGVLFWNAAGALGMCGHATIGLARSLAWAGHDLPREAVLETRVGSVTVRLGTDGTIGFANVASYVHARDVEVVLEQGGIARGDVAWGGNWFFIVRHDGGPSLGATSRGKAGRAMRTHAEELAYAESIARGIARAGLRGGPENGGVIDHVAIIFTPSRGDADARNFVLCPNGTFDRSPCGTGTSALLASLAARGELAPGALWRQESAIGSLFLAHYAPSAAGGGRVVPTIEGRAFVVGEGSVVEDHGDPSARGGWIEEA
jgi:4-hydroxyproline epimerase